MINSRNFPSLTNARVHRPCAPRHRRIIASSHQHDHPPAASTRRAALLTTSLLPLLLSQQPPQPAHAFVEGVDEFSFPTTTPSSSDPPQVTDKAFIEFGLCPEGVRADRRLGDKSILCSDPEPIGRVVIALYGQSAPGTVSNFKLLIESAALHGTALSKIFPGRWIVAGQQGSRRNGLLEAPPGLARNPDILSSSAFRLRHLYPGAVSLNLSENEDDDALRFGLDRYQPLSFLITTGPAPAPSLDGENIVFGRVIEGLDTTIAAVAAVPTFQPYGNQKTFNDIANFIGDERASKTKAKWGKPLKAVVITNTGLL